MSTISQDLENFWSNGVKPNLCAFAFTGLGVYFLSPMLVPYVGRVPVIGSFGSRAQEAILAGVYGVGSVSLCAQLGLAKFL